MLSPKRGVSVDMRHSGEELLNSSGILNSAFEPKRMILGKEETWEESGNEVSVAPLGR
jgi:hypothetical protein